MIPTEKCVSKIEAFDLKWHIGVMSRRHIVIVSEKDTFEPRGDDNVQLRQILNRV